MSARRDFTLPPADEAFLEGYGLPWEAVKNGAQWLLLHELPLPPGYKTSTASVAIRIEAGYPVAPLDMAYFHPVLQRADGKSIRATESMQNIDGKQWQRWSRHRTAANPWKPAEDTIETHLLLIHDWLAREFRQ